jgi:hypothetical protein
VTQPQRLFEQVWPVPHAAPQAPQLSASLATLIHAVPHSLSPAAHDAEHAPWLQKGIAPEHTTPQAPQFAGLDCVSTHVAPQR